ncbi:MAG TPA: TetR-like C-terminal domain-containing protein [Trueperaceae bacterium]
MAYHHGSLKEDLLAAAARVVADRGPAGLSLRELARELGVTHTAPRHHFGDKRGVLTALAAQGHRLLAGRLVAAGDDFLEAGVAYVRFALDHPGHFSVMFRPDLVDEASEELRQARSRTRSALLRGAAAYAGPSFTADASLGATTEASGAATEGGRGALARSGAELPPFALLAWSAAHGMASLALSGALSAMGMGSTPEELTRSARAGLQRLTPP